MAPRPEVLGDGTVRREKALRVAGGLEALHPPFPLARRLVGILCAVVQITMLTMFDAEQHLLFRRTIAPQFIGDDYSRHVREPLEQLTEEPLRRPFVPPGLYEDIKNMAILVDRPPQIMAGAIDGEEDFIQMPLVARPRPSAPQRIRIGLPKLPAPIPHGFVGQADAALGHQFFDVVVAQAKAEI